MEEFKGNLIITGVTISIGLTAEKMFKIPVFSLKSWMGIATTSLLVFASTVVAKELMLLLVKEEALGYDKVPNEGFIGPYPKHTYIGPHGN